MRVKGMHLVAFPPQLGHGHERQRQQADKNERGLELQTVRVQAAWYPGLIESGRQNIGLGATAVHHAAGRHASLHLFVGDALALGGGLPVRLHQRVMDGCTDRGFGQGRMAGDG